MSIFKKKPDYFYESFSEIASYSLKAILRLKEGINNFDANKLEFLKNEVHEIEHEADIKKHEIEERLAKEFITPIDREDIFLLLDKIDNLTDAIDDVSYILYLRNYNKLPENTDIFILKCEDSILALIEVLKNMDKISNKKIMDPLIDKVLEIEREVDHLYEINVRDLYLKEEEHSFELRKSEKLYSLLEEVTDNAKEVVKEIQIIMYKNL